MAPVPSSTLLKKRSWPRNVLLCLAASLVIQIIYKGFWGNIVVLVTVVFGLLVVAQKRDRIKPALPWLLLVASFTLFEEYVGHYSLWLDLIIFIIALGMVKAVSLLRADAKEGRRTFSFSIGALFLVWLLFWIFASIADSRLLKASVPVNGWRQVPDSAKLNIGLALSGGGYRAALFHAGVLSILEREHVGVTRLSGVSGGAIIGSFYALGGSPEQFVNLVQQGRFNLRREMFDLPDGLGLAGSIHMPESPYTILPFGQFTRTDAQARMLRHVLGDVWMGYKHSADQVQLMICVTDIEKQEMIGVTAEGLVIQPLIPAVDRLPVVNPSHPEKRSPYAAYYRSFSEDSVITPVDWPESVAELVAASTAFPGALRAVPLLDAAGVKRGSPTWWWRYNEDLPEDFTLIRRLLADGGIGDNTGLALLRDAHELSVLANSKRNKTTCDKNVVTDERKFPQCWDLTDWESSLFIASDGSAIIPIPSYSADTNALREATTAIDVATLGSGGAPSETFHNDSVTPDTLLISPRAILAMPYSPNHLNDSDLVDFPIKRNPPEGCVFRDLATLMETYIPPGQCDIRGFSLVSLTDAALRFIIAGMPTDRRSQAEQYLRELEHRGAYDKGRWQLDSWPEGSTQYRLHLLIREELRRCLVAFLQLSTLNDHPTRESAERVYRLGQYVTMINLPIIKTEIDKLSATKPPAP